MRRRASSSLERDGAIVLGDDLSDDRDSAHRGDGRGRHDDSSSEGILGKSCNKTSFYK